MMAIRRSESGNVGLNSAGGMLIRLVLRWYYRLYDSFVFYHNPPTCRVKDLGNRYNKGA
jgi:hypothetical protein